MSSRAPAPTNPPGLVVTDLDGTLLDSASRLSDVNRRTLETLGRNGVVRAVATGRSLYSARLVMHEDFPVDYLAFSSGAGIVSWEDRRLLRSPAMDPALVSRLVARLRGLFLRALGRLQALSDTLRTLVQHADDGLVKEIR